MRDRRCKNCFCWTRNEEFIDGYCSSGKFEYGFGRNGDTRADGLQYWDAEGYYAGFMTGEDFGCIHFKLRSRI